MLTSRAVAPLMPLSVAFRLVHGLQCTILVPIIPVYGNREVCMDKTLPTVKLQMVAIGHFAIS